MLLEMVLGIKNITSFRTFCKVVWMVRFPEYPVRPHSLRAQTRDCERAWKSVPGSRMKVSRTWFDGSLVAGKKETVSAYFAVLALDVGAILPDRRRR